MSKVGLFRGSHGRHPTTTGPLGTFFVASLPADNSGGCPHHSHPLKQGPSSDTKWWGSQWRIQYVQFQLPLSYHKNLPIGCSMDEGVVLSSSQVSRPILSLPGCCNSRCRWWHDNAAPSQQSMFGTSCWTGFTLLSPFENWVFDGLHYSCCPAKS